MSSVSKMSSTVIFDSFIGGNLTQEIMNNQRDQDHESFDQNDDRTASSLFIVVYFSLLLIAIVLGFLASKGRELEEVLVKRKRIDRPPSYRNLFFGEDPPKYHEIV